MNRWFTATGQRGMQIAIHDFEIRYEDENSGICGPYRILGRLAKL